MKIELMQLKPNDPDLSKLIRIHNQPSVAEFISISENYFDYVTETEGVVYHKIMADGRTAGGIHCEFSDRTLYLSICVDEDCRRKGIAETALKQLLNDLPAEAETVEVSIDETNHPSICLFEKLGFPETERQDELITYRLAVK